MRVGLIGTPRTPELCLMKRRIEDRGHGAVFVNLREFPQYVLSSVDPSRFRLDHTGLLELDCFYLHDLEGRNRFFRGTFGKETWVALQERYTDFADSERENRIYQTSFLTALSRLRPFINQPREFLRASLRPLTLWRLASVGIAIADFGVDENPAGEDCSRLRVRVGEEGVYDVPCFPRDADSCLGLDVCADRETLAIVALSGQSPVAAVARNGETRKSSGCGDDVAEIAGRVLDTLDLETAEIRLARGAEGVKIVEVLPAPALRDFEDVTGDPVSDRIAERLLAMGGSQ